MPFDGRPPTPDWPRCSAAEIARIARLRDPVRRNLEITQSYHQLTLALGRRLGRRDLPWTGFAVWASKTAGHFIRGDWLPPELRTAMTRRGGALARGLVRVEAVVRAHLAEGNRRVYAEIAPLFAALLPVLDAPPMRREAEATALLERLRPGSVQRRGQDGLARAMRAYLEASLRDGDERAQLLLLANLEIGAHEQWRLQGPIEGALEATVAALPPRARPRMLRRRLATRLRRPLTRWMMRLHTPELVLHMGRDVPALPDGRMFPSELEHIRVPELGDLLAEIDRTPGTTRGSAARDWADYGDRMSYVADMFRVHQQAPALWRPPFRAEQVEALSRGRAPVGPL